jgi:hypothetical protein
MSSKAVADVDRGIPGQGVFISSLGGTLRSRGLINRSRVVDWPGSSRSKDPFKPCLISRNAMSGPPNGSPVGVCPQPTLEGYQPRYFGCEVMLWGQNILPYITLSLLAATQSI